MSIIIILFSAMQNSIFGFERKHNTHPLFCFISARKGVIVWVWHMLLLVYPFSALLNAI